MDTDDNVHYYMHTDIIYIAILHAWITNHLKLPKIPRFDNTPTFAIAIMEPSNHVHMVILGGYAHVSSKYWSGQNRTNRTACAGPVNMMLPSTG